MPSPYAGRNEIFLNAAAGRGQEADGGSTRGAGRSATYTLRIGSIRDQDHPWQAFPTVRNIESIESARTTACKTGSSSRSTETCSGTGYARRD